MEKLNVKVDYINNRLVTTSTRVAHELGVTHDQILETINNLRERFDSDESINEFYISIENEIYGISYLITKKGIAQLVGSFSSITTKAFDLNIAYINTFDKLEKDYKNKAREEKEEAIKLDFLAAEQISNIMRYNDSSKAILVNKLIDEHKLNNVLKIDYTKSNGILSSPSSLLKKFSINMSANKFNKLLMENGFLEEKERKSRKTDLIKKFKSLTEKGLEYGENMVSTNNTMETQPCYYEEKFLELIKKINSKEE
ncbi:MAG: Rha family transcriptional regulator [Cetobacterium sp.]|uniref:Rha family transcriptional regulator n=1 Tax=Cetobacterium sp. TaxID=2071632 RepID=UPI003F3CB59E